MAFPPFTMLNPEPRSNTKWPSLVTSFPTHSLVPDISLILLRSPGLSVPPCNMVILLTEAASVLEVSLNSESWAFLEPTLGLPREPTLATVIPPESAPAIVILLPATGRLPTVPEASTAVRVRVSMLLAVALKSATADKSLVPLTLILRLTKVTRPSEAVNDLPEVNLVAPSYRLTLSKS